jgi:hypothetical protein
MGAQAEEEQKSVRPAVAPYYCGAIAVDRPRQNVFLDLSGRGLG